MTQEESQNILVSCLLYTDRVSLFVPAAAADDLVAHDGGGRAVQHRARVGGQPQQLRRGVGGHRGAAHKQSINDRAVNKALRSFTVPREGPY